MAATTGVSTAEDASRGPNSALEQVYVTGSRIFRQDYEANSPIVTVSDLEIEKTGEVSVEMSLQQLPQFTPDMNATVPLLSNGGRAQLSLRGLGAQRNLVLLDGRRMVSSDLGGSIDINNIPSTLIQSVEVITGGASAVYGSEAISGVVNFKINRDFEGFEVDAQYGESFRGDAGSQQYGVTMGADFADNRGNAVLHFNFMERDLIKLAARDFYDDANRSGTLPHGAFVPAVTNLPTQAAVDSVFAQYGVAPGTVARTRNLGFNDDNTLFPTTGTIVNYQGPDRPFMEVLPTSLRQPVGQHISLVQPIERYGAFGTMNYEVGGNVHAYGQFYIAQNDVSTTAGSATANVLVPVTNPFVPDDLRTILESRPDPAAPFSLSKTLGEAGLRTFGYRFTTYQLLAGFQGELPISDWTWDLYASHGTSSQRFATLGSTDSEIIQDLMDDPDGGAARCDGGLDLFGFNNGVIGNNTISAECQQLIIRQPKTETNTRQNDVQATITGGFGKLPAGDVRFAATAGYRNYGYDFRPDSTSFSEVPEGGTNFESFVDAEDSLWDTSIELLIPLLWDKPGARELNINVAGRYSNYKSTGGSSTYKADMEWQPVSQLRFRGGYQRAYRAPNPAELYGGAQSTRANLGSPTGGGGDPCDTRGLLRNGPNGAQIRALCIGVGLPEVLADTYVFLRDTTGGQMVGNPDVQPEDADTYTFGVVWSPEFEVVNFQASLDVYDIEVTGAISSIPVEVLLNKCYNVDGSNPTYDPNNFFCAQHTRDPNTGEIENIRLPNLNLGGLRTSGIDLQANASFELGFGTLSLNGVFNYVDKWERKVLPDSQWENVNGAVTPVAGNPFQPFSPKWRGVLGISYDFLDRFQVGTRVRYIDSMIDVVALTNPAAAPPGVKAYTYADLDAAWRINETFRLRAGVVNVFDKEPPIVRGTPGVTNQATYDAIGRRYFIGLKASF
jgi:outer membrane receptor protein involved in Fe transport